MPRKKKSDQPTPDTPETVAAAGTVDQPGNTTVIDTPEKVFQPYQPSEEKTTRKQRISFNVTEEGLLDTEGVRGETLANVKKFFQDPRNAALLGTAKIEDVISEKDVHMVVDGIAYAEAQLFHFTAKIDLDIAMKHAQWSDAEKKTVTEPIQRIAAKYAASLGFYLKWKDEIMLGVIMLTVSRAKLENAKKEQAWRVEQAKTANPALQPASVNVNLPNMGLDAVSSEITKN